VTCASCGGPSDNGTGRCTWCTGADTLAAKRDAAKPEHDQILAQHYATSRTQYSAGSGMSTVWMIRVCIGVALIMLRMCLAASH
jgi:hypothetical protein